VGRIYEDVSTEIAKEELRIMIEEINQIAEESPQRRKLPSYTALGIDLAARLKRSKPYTAKTICLHMQELKYKPNRNTRKFDYDRKYIPEDFLVQYPCIMYIPKLTGAERNTIINWIESTFPDYLEEVHRTEKGLLIIANNANIRTEFVQKFHERWDSELAIQKKTQKQKKSKP
jgi:hypothetical protein